MLASTDGCCPTEMELAIEPPVWNPGGSVLYEMRRVTEDKLSACHDDLEGHLPPGAPYQERVVVLSPFWLRAVVFIRSWVLSWPGRGVLRFGQQTLMLRGKR